MTQESDSQQPWFQFGLRHLFIWVGALGCALALGRIKENYEPYLGDLGGLAILLAVVAMGATCGALTGQTLLRRGGRIVGVVLGVVLLFVAFIVFVNIE